MGRGGLGWDVLGLSGVELARMGCRLAGVGWGDIGRDAVRWGMRVIVIVGVAWFCSLHLVRKLRQLRGGIREKLPFLCE